MRLGHFKQLFLFQPTDGEFVHLHLDAGLFGELGQKFDHRVVMGMGRDIDGDRFASVLGVAVLGDGAADGQAGTKDSERGGIDERSAQHHESLLV